MYYVSPRFIVLSRGWSMTEVQYAIEPSITVISHYIPLKYVRYKNT